MFARPPSMIYESIPIADQGQVVGKLTDIAFWTRIFPCVTLAWNAELITHP